MKKLVDMTPEELTAFNDEFKALLDKHSAYLEPVPTFQKVKSEQEDGFTWGIRGNLFVQKVIVEEEKKDETPKEN